MVKKTLKAIGSSVKQEDVIDPNGDMTANEVEDLKNITIKDLDSKMANQISDFAMLLNTLSSVEEKTKSLWKQIYENAVTDRKNSYIMWIDLYTYVHSNPNEHAIHGQNLSRYIERMSKANEQMIKLADLVSKASDEQIEGSVSEEDIYDRILSHKQ